MSCSSPGGVCVICTKGPRSPTYCNNLYQKQSVEKSTFTGVMWRDCLLAVTSWSPVVAVRQQPTSRDSDSFTKRKMNKGLVLTEIITTWIWKYIRIQKDWRIIKDYNPLGVQQLNRAMKRLLDSKVSKKTCKEYKQPAFSFCSTASNSVKTTKELIEQWRKHWK